MHIGKNNGGKIRSATARTHVTLASLFCARHSKSRITRLSVACRGSAHKRRVQRAAPPYAGRRHSARLRAFIRALAANARRH